MITILYFASLREQLGCAREQLECPPEIITLGDLRTYLCTRGEPWSQLLNSEALVMMSLNQALTDQSSLVANGDEIAFFPPVTGG